MTCEPPFIASCLRNAQTGLAKFADEINQLNVFPVPDGDTGSNMLSTVSAAADAAESYQSEELAEFVSKVARAGLLGGRGNSGVILSQVLTGLVGGLTGAQSFEQAWSEAVGRAAELGRSAVLAPKEGTILSVMDAAAAGAKDGVLASLEKARDALVKTPTQLEALARAGVVDSGGAGLVIVLEEFIVTAGFKVEHRSDYPWLAVVPKGPAESHDSPDAQGEEAEASDLRYEVIFVLTAGPAQMEGFRSVWAGLGESIVIVGQDDLHRCHIHTNEIGPAIEAGIQAGAVSDISVTDLRDQVAERDWVLSGEGNGVSASRRSIATAVVAVGDGEGVARLFRSFGVKDVVSGGQGRNPSTEELLQAVESQNADGVVLLPNDPNVFAAAAAVVELASRPVMVVPTSHVMEGFSALMSYDPDSELPENVARMKESARRARWGELTRASRNGVAVTGPFDVGDWIGITAQGIVNSAKEVTQAAEDLVAGLVTERSEILTLLLGRGVSPRMGDEVVSSLQSAFPQLETEVHEGNQPVYPFIFAVE